VARHRVARPSSRSGLPAAPVASVAACEKVATPARLCSAQGATHECGDGGREGRGARLALDVHEGGTKRPWRRTRVGASDADVRH
jgi:hypothetical protein